MPTSRHPAIVLTLLITLPLLFGCTDAGLLAPDPPAEAAQDAAVADQVTAKAGVTTETAVVVGQGADGPVVAGAEATIRRTANGISASVSMPTPSPGTYAYPAAAEAGHPEVFTLWVFIFNDPEADDWDGAFLGAGHAVAGSHLELSGHISRRSEPFVGDGLENPGGAKVHLAVAPHGALDPEQLPEQMQTPAGTADHWWFALFD